MPLCTDLVLVNANQQRGEIKALKCKRWKCEICNPDNRWKVMCKARDGLPNLFLTLTVSDKGYEDENAQARDMKRGLVLLRRRIEAHWGIKNIPFIVVFERHKRGQPHMHLLLRAPYLHQKVLLGMWRDIMGSGGVNTKFVKNKEKILFYITKYIGKDLAHFEGCKRWWRSQNFNVVKEEREPIILFGECLYIDRVSLEYLHDRLKRDGMIVSEIKRGGFSFTSRRCMYQAQNYQMPWRDARRVK